MFRHLVLKIILLKVNYCLSTIKLISENHANYFETRKQAADVFQ